jgi:hypothetical protein
MGIGIDLSHARAALRATLNYRRSEGKPILLKRFSDQEYVTGAHR